MSDFFTNTYPRLCKTAYEAGAEARINGLPKECNLVGEDFMTPGGNILRVYKEAWEYGWVGRVASWPTQ